ncbi:hypothetical protein [Alistipes finegoldii]|uniref:hypothetical protein n=1 Tax=Alistipes finegoldii TaxID=214856 RepID=UPI003AB49EB6
MQNNKSKQKQAEKETPTNWQRIEMVIQQSKLTVNAFARHIGLPRGENLYQIKKGNNGISLDVATRICQHYPEIDKLWLLTGDGQMLRDDAPAGPWSHTGTSNSEAFRAWAAVHLLPVFIEKGSPAPATAALDQVDELLKQLAKKGGEQ